jgi:predicted tellurium resistance membrane protein TerC
MTELLTVENLIALGTLTALEIVLGIDNIVFIAILVGKLEPALRGKARVIGLGLAMVLRVLLLLAIGWIMTLTRPLLHVSEHPITGRDLILLLGGLFLIGKATYEIHDKMEGAPRHGTGAAASSFRLVLLQIALIDIVFSLDSVITAVGMVKHVSIMIAAVVLAVAFMLIFSGPIAHFVERHPTMKMLALSFLVLIGVMLVAESFHHVIPRGYIYFAMTFSLVVELLNIRVRKRAAPVELHQTYVALPAAVTSDSRTA